MLEARAYCQISKYDILQTSFYPLVRPRKIIVVFKNWNRVQGRQGTFSFLLFFLGHQKKRSVGIVSLSWVFFMNSVYHREYHTLKLGLYTHVYLRDEYNDTTCLWVIVFEGSKINCQNMNKSFKLPQKTKMHMRLMSPAQCV